MKISEILYKCAWCNNEQEDRAIPRQAVEPINWHGQIICNKCGRHISQK